MNAVKKARRLIEADPFSESTKTLAGLVLALESGVSFDVARLYDLDMKTFEVAIDIFKEWRIDRYYAGKGKLFDLSVMVKDLTPAA